MKRTIVSPMNVLTTVKAIVTSLLSMVILLVPLVFAWWLQTQEMYSVAIIFNILSFLAYLWVWGWIATKLWSWK